MIYLTSPAFMNYFHEFGTHKINACLPCKQYSRPRMRSNRSPLVKCLTVSATKSCSELYLITYNRKFSTCAARKESLDGALRHCNIHVRFLHTNLHEI